jgi:hypothetical protein
MSEWELTDLPKWQQMLYKLTMESGPWGLFYRCSDGSWARVGRGWTRTGLWQVRSSLSSRYDDRHFEVRLWWSRP